MNPRICSVKHDPPRSYGDCVRACVATIIDRDDVPHCFDGRVFNDGILNEDAMLGAWKELREYLKQHGKYIAILPTENHTDLMRNINPGVPYILWCSTARGFDHVVVCCDGEVIHDPAWYTSQITGPTKMGVYLIGLIGDLV